MNVYLRFLSYSIFLAIGFLVVTYGICYNMISNGLSNFELTMFSLMIGLIFLVISFISSTVFLYKYKKDCINQRIIALKGFYQFGLILCFSLFSIIILDALYFEFIDKSVPKTFADSMSDILLKGGQSEEAVNGLAQLPLMLQNGIIVFIGAIIGIPFAIIVSSSFIKMQD